jgi:hypothetical protein
VHVDELSAGEVWELFETLLRSVRYVLKYLPGFEPLHRRTNGPQFDGGDHGVVFRITEVAPRVSEGLEWLGGRTKVALVERLVDIETDSRRVVRELLFTDDGVLLFWNAEYEVSPCSCPEHRDCTAHERTIWSSFELLGRKEFCREERQTERWGGWRWRALPIRAVVCLHELTLRGVNERRRRLEAIEQARDALNEPLTRIQTL